jgi:hypothetical protein
LDFRAPYILEAVRNFLVLCFLKRAGKTKKERKSGRRRFGGDNEDQKGRRDGEGIGEGRGEAKLEGKQTFLAGAFLEISRFGA